MNGKTTNIFQDMFGPKTRKVTIKALDNAEVVIRDLSLKQQADFISALVDGYDEEGLPIINYDKAADIRLAKISAALVEPAMTVEELGALGVDAKEALDELYAYIDPKGAQAVKEEMERAGEEGK